MIPRQGQSSTRDGKVWVSLERFLSSVDATVSSLARYLVGAYKVNGGAKVMHIRRQSELLQLIDDISLDIHKLKLSGELEHYDLSLISQIMEMLESLRPMQIGTAGVLDSIQYLLGEIQTGRDERDSTYIDVGNVLIQIQDYLDWLDFLKPNRQESY